jgi:hypothetical protein
MNTKILSQSAMDMIDQYKNFQIGNAICSIPYFNNKRHLRKVVLRVNAGKGSPKEIFHELKDIFVLNKINQNDVDSDNLKKILVNNDIGIDLSLIHI